MFQDLKALTALSPLDGRYLSSTIELRDYFSESALIKYRILVEVLYLIELVEFLNKGKFTPHLFNGVGLTKTEKNKLLDWAKNLKPRELAKVKKIEAEIHHDVKAVEYFIKVNLKRLKLTQFSSWLHWGLTSEDVNNLAYGLMIQNVKDKILIPLQLQLIKVLLQLVEKYSDVVMPARTHGQIAVPTTVGKELVVFASRAEFFLEKIVSFKLGGKLNGAVGNFNAHQQIFPQKNWLSFSKKFIKKLGLEPVMITTQIKPNTRLVYFLDILRQLNNVWLDLAQDYWLYISFDYFVQKVVAKEVGSSTMPHKVNPINFENAEGNFQLANSFLMTLANKFPISRLQRDLSDSTVKRNLGMVFGYSLLGAKSLIKGLRKIQPNKSLLEKEVSCHPEMLSEGLQLILKLWGNERAYEKIKLKTRGEKVSWEKLIEQLSINKERKKILKKWETKDYIGLASKLTNIEIKRIKKRLFTKVL